MQYLLNLSYMSCVVLTNRLISGVMMKKLIIPAILATAFISPVFAMETTAAVEPKAEEIYFVGQDEIKLEGNVSLKFSNLIGYKTKEDAKNQVNGTAIGLLVSGVYNLNNSFVKDECASQSWWTNYGYSVDRITVSDLNSKCIYKQKYKFKELIKFINKFEVLSPDSKAIYLNDLRSAATSMIDDCEMYDYDRLRLAVDVLNYLINLKEYSNADKVALFNSYLIISLSYVEKLEEDRSHSKHAAEHKAVKAFFKPTPITDMFYYNPVTSVTQVYVYSNDMYQDESDTEEN